MKTLKDVQGEVDDWISGYADGYWNPFILLTRLTEEVGELARALNHMHGPKKQKEGEIKASVQEEMGDVLFTLACIANSHGIDLSESFDSAMDKCHSRDKDRFEKKS